MQKEHDRIFYDIDIFLESQIWMAKALDLELYKYSLVHVFNAPTKSKYIDVQFLH